MKALLKKIIPPGIRRFLSGVKADAVKRREQAVEERSEDFTRRQGFYAQFLKPGDTCFDIGANYGNRIGPIRKTGAKIIAVEPQKSCCAYLRETYKDIIVLQKGVGAAAGKQTFFISSDSVLSSFSKDFIAKTGNTRFTGNTWNNSEEVEITTLDLLIKEYGIPAFIKVDVEGFEPEVFKGLTKKINIVSFEYTLPELSDNIPPILEKLNSLGNCVFNYSTGESMKLEMTEWMNYESMKTFAGSESFIKTGFGDIYAKFI